MKAINPGMKACLSDGRSTTVTDVLVDPTDGVEKYIVLSANGYFGPDVVAPASAIWRVDEQVHVALSCADLTSLPHYNAYTYCRETGLRSRAAARRPTHHHHHVAG